MRRAAAAAAGPLAAMGGSLFLLRGLVFGGRLPLQYADVLGLWLPTYSFLGTSLAAGHVPSWNPHVMGGAPFAADPQSGWMYLPAMVLFAAFRHGVALRAYVALAPCLGGVAMYGFLRREGLSRPAAAIGGCALAFPVAGSALALQLPLAASVAWTAVLLWAAACAWCARSWPARLLWIGAAALAWGQMAAALLSQGALVGTAVLAVYLGAKWAQGRRTGRISHRRAAAVVGLIAAASLLINLAYLWPRLRYVPRTTIGLGYERIAALSRSLGPAGSAREAISPGLSPGWPLRLALPAGLYLGAAVLVLAASALRSTTHRALAAAFGSLAVLFYALSTEPVARLLHPVGSTFVGGLYVHDPGRLGLVLLVAVPVLAAVGAEAWWSRRRPSPTERVLVAAGAALFVVLPLALGEGPASVAAPAAGLAATVAVLSLARRSPSWRAAVPAVVALELVAVPVASQWGMRAGLDRNAPGVDFQMTRGTVSLASSFRPGPIARALRARRGARYVSWDPSGWQFRGLHLNQQPQDAGLMATQRSMVFGLEEAQGYDSVQLLRYWEFVRAENTRAIKYNASYFSALPRQAIDLLDIGFVVAPAGSPPAGVAPAPVAREGTWGLFRVRTEPSRVGLVTAWRVVRSPRAQLSQVTRPSFDPTRSIVLRRGPAFASAAGSAGTASYREEGPQAARVVVRASRPGILLIRNVCDPGWHATVDGRSTPVMAADFFLQGVQVPAGRHVVQLRYDDPAVGHGLLGSALSLMALLAAAAAAGLRRHGAGTARQPRVAESALDGERSGREAAAAGTHAGTAPRRGGGVLGRGRLGPGGRGGREDAS